MLRITSSLNDQIAVQKMSPSQYIEFLDHQAKLAFEKAFLNHAKNGLGLKWVSGVPVGVVTDPEKYKTHLIRTTNCDERFAQLEIESLELQGPEHFGEQVLRCRDVVSQCAATISDRPDLHEFKFSKVPVDLTILPFFNAGAGPVPKGGDIVLVHQGLMWLDTWMSCWHLCSWNDQILDRDSEMMIIRASLPALARTILGIAEPKDGFVAIKLTAISALMNMEQQLLAFIAESYAWQFILLHEFGHIALGHTQTLRRWRPEHELSRAKLAARRAEMREFESAADLFAVKHFPPPAMRRSGSTLKPAYDLLVPVLAALFGLFRLGEQPQDGDDRDDDHRDGPGSDHPPAAERFRDVLAAFKLSVDLKPIISLISDLPTRCATAR